MNLFCTNPSPITTDDIVELVTNWFEIDLV